MENVIKKNRRFFSSWKKALLVCSLFLLAFLFFMITFDLTPNHKIVLPVLFVLFFFLIILWIVSIIRFSVKKPFTKNLFTAISLVVFFVFCILVLPYAALYTFVDGEVYFTSVSPSGKNKVLVFEGGLIDAAYTAYPEKYLFFHQYQENGFVSKHDRGPGNDVQVSWLSDDLAQVKIDAGDFDPNEGSNEDGIIVVRFE